MRKTLIFTGMMLFALAALPPAAPGAGPADALEDVAAAKAALEKNDYQAALASLRNARELIWNQAPLSVRNVVFLTGEPEGYGLYTPRDSGRFETVEPLLLYCEPLGYTVLKEGDVYTISLSTEFSVVDKSGKVMAGPFQTAPAVEKSRAFKTEYMIFFTFNLKGAPAGDYILKVTVHDHNSSKNVTFDKPFSVIQ